MVEGTDVGRASPVIAAVSRDSRTSRRTRTPRLYLHCTLAGPRWGNLEGKREQCHVRSGAYMRISVCSPGNRHLRIIGCCAEAATLGEQSGRMEGERPTTRRRTAPPLATSHLSQSLFYLLLPSPPLPSPAAALRPLHHIVPLRLVDSTLFISLALASSHISTLYHANSDIPFALSCALISVGRALRSFSIPFDSLVLSLFFPLLFRSFPLPFLTLSLSLRLIYFLSHCRHPSAAATNDHATRFSTLCLPSSAS